MKFNYYTYALIAAGGFLGAVLRWFIDVVDTEEKIMAIVPEVEAMVEHGIVIVQKVQMGRKAKK